MADTEKRDDLDETKRIMERLVKTPPKPHEGKEKPKDGDKSKDDKVSE